MPCFKRVDPVKVVKVSPGSLAATNFYELFQVRYWPKEKGYNTYGFSHVVFRRSILEFLFRRSVEDANRLIVTKLERVKELG